MTLKTAGIHLFLCRHSSEGWNPVVLIIHSRCAGMTTEVLFRQAGRNRNRPNILASLPGFRPSPGILGRLFQTRLYRLPPVGVPSRRIQDFLGGLFPTPPYHLHPCKRIHK